MKKNVRKVTRNEQVNLIDIFYYLLSNWYWFVLCVIISLGVAYYRYARMPYVYSNQITAILKDPSTGPRSARLDTYSNMINTISLTTEELQLRSWTLMAEVVKALDIDVSYTEHIKFRDVELYTSLSPVKMVFDREWDDPGMIDIMVTPLEGEVLRIDMGAAGMQSVAFGDTVSLGKGSVVFYPTHRYGPDYYNVPIHVRKSPVPNAAVYFAGRVRVSDNKNGTMTISLSDANAQRVADILNMLVVKYNEDAIREKNKVAVNTSKFIEERLRIIEEELGGVEGSLAQFQSSNQLMNVNEAASTYLGESRAYKKDVVELETRISLATYLRDYIMGQENNFQMIPANTGLDDPNIESLIEQYNQQVFRRGQLVKASSLESPAVKQIETTMLSLRRNILSLINNLLRGLEMSRKDLQQREEESIRKYSAMPNKARQMLEIERQQSIKEELYVFLLNKREESQLTQAMADDNIRPVDPATANYTPSSPQRMKIMLLAFLVGLAIPAFILIARLFLDTKIRTRKEIEENIDVPFLAEIPLNKEMRNFIWKSKHHRKGQKSPSPFVYESSSNSVFTEAMRMMCTNLNFLDPDSVPPMVVGTTSYSSNSGKTFIVANMGACLADAQKRVVLVDTDMRKRSLSGDLGLKHKTKGLSNYLYDLDMTLDDILHKDVKPGVDFIPAGSTPPNPAELLSRPRFDDLIKQLRDRYDYILLDGVPVQLLSEPLIVNRVVDCNLFILRSGQLDRRILPQLDELNENRHLTNMAIVFNGPEVKRRHGYGFGTYGYGYGYGYGNGYGYGYNDTEDEKKSFWKRIFHKK
jgi:capsular exopolysaccharide synthesis family protein